MISYEVCFTRHFYKSRPLRALAEISKLRDGQMSPDTVFRDPHLLDLLFFHRHLRRLIAVELNLESFQPAHVGQSTSRPFRRCRCCANDCTRRCNTPGNRLPGGTTTRAILDLVRSMRDLQQRAAHQYRPVVDVTFLNAR